MKHALALAILVLATAAQPRPAQAVMPYTPHACAEDAKRQALTLLQAYAGGAGKVAVSDGIVRHRGAIEVPKEKVFHDILVVEGSIDRVEYEVSLFYTRSPGQCLLYGHKIDPKAAPEPR